MSYFMVLTFHVIVPPSVRSSRLKVTSTAYLCVTSSTFTLMLCPPVVVGSKVFTPSVLPTTVSALTLTAKTDAIMKTARLRDKNFFI